MNWSLSQIAAAVNGRLVGADVTVEGVSTDTRAIAKGALFIALAGERFDAHDFLEQAVAAGAGALLVADAGKLPAGVSAVVVDEPAWRWAAWPLPGAPASRCRSSPLPVPTARRRPRK